MFRIDVNKASSTVREKEKLVAGSVNNIFCQFNFSSDWDGLNITAIFAAGDVSIGCPLAGETRCAIPPETLEIPGNYLKVGFKGTNVDGDIIVQPTTMEIMGLINAGPPAAAGGKDPTPSEYDKIYKVAMDAKRTADSVKTAADNGDFDGDKGDKGDKGDTGPRGPSGLVSSVSTNYAKHLTIAANTMTHIAALEGAVTLTLGAPLEGYDNEWDFTLTQGDAAYDVALPVIRWGLGIAPSFSAKSTTVCRLYRVGDILCGEWVTV